MSVPRTVNRRHFIGKCYYSGVKLAFGMTADLYSAFTVPISSSKETREAGSSKLTRNILIRNYP